MKTILKSAAAITISLAILISIFFCGFGYGTITANKENTAKASSVEETKIPVSFCDKVYVVYGGKWFHQYGCKSLGDSKDDVFDSNSRWMSYGDVYATTVEKASDDGKKACEMCFSDAKEFNANAKPAKTQQATTQKRTYGSSSFSTQTTKRRYASPRLENKEIVIN